MARNTEAEGKSSVQDDDLLSMQLEMSGTLPWLTDLLEEVQYLRDFFKAPHKYDEQCPACERYVTVTEKGESDDDE
jgi:hypothetical protein